MSTYLVAILVSDYECENGNADTLLSGKVDVAVCVRPNAFNQIDFAVESAKYFIAFFEKYFNIKYPLPKLGKISAHLAILRVILQKLFFYQSLFY